MDHDHGNPEQPPSFWRTRYGIGCLVIGAVAAYFLLTEHLAHTVSALPYLLLAACPLMHIFMHGGHGGHGHGHHGHHDHGNHKVEEKGATPGNPHKGDQP